MVSSPDDPQLHSTGVVEDANKHDEVVALKLSYTYRGCFFTVILSNKPARDPSDGRDNTQTTSVVQSLITRYNQACTWTNADKSVEDVDKRLDPIWEKAEDLVATATFERIRKLGRKYGQQSSGNDVGTTTGKDLASHIFPQSFNLELSIDKAGSRTTCRPDLPRNAPFAVEHNVKLQPGLISVDAADVQILELYRPHVLKVQVGEEIYCCKLNNAGAQDSFQREYETLKEVNCSESRDLIKTPKLKGFVQVEDGVVGLLMDNIDTEALNLTVVLEHNANVSRTERQRWSKQISEALQHLHNLDLVWGDVKTDNVLVDKARNAWLVDFGGGYTAGWVGEASYNTQAGDLEGLARIISVINEER